MFNLGFWRSNYGRWIILNNCMGSLWFRILFDKYIIFIFFCRYFVMCMVFVKGIWCNVFRRFYFKRVNFCIDLFLREEGFFDFYRRIERFFCYGIVLFFISWFFYFLFIIIYFYRIVGFGDIYFINGNGIFLFIVSIFFIFLS